MALPFGRRTLSLGADIPFDRDSDQRTRSSLDTFHHGWGGLFSGVCLPLGNWEGHIPPQKRKQKVSSGKLLRMSLRLYVVKVLAINHCEYKKWI